MTGTLRQPGEVFFANIGRSCTTAPCLFSFDATQGIYDLVAVNKEGARSTKFIARRDVMVDMDTSQPDLDFTTEGIALQSTQLLVDGLDPTESLATFLVLTTGHGSAKITNQPFASDASVEFVDPANLRSTDVQTLELITSGVGTLRSVIGTYKGQAKVALLPPTDVTFSASALASWQPITSHYDRLHAIVETPSATQEHVQEIIATRSWVESSGKSSLVWPSDVPGDSGEWHVDPAGGNNRFSIIAETDGLAQTTTMYAQ